MDKIPTFPGPFTETELRSNAADLIKRNQWDILRRTAGSLASAHFDDGPRFLQEELNKYNQVIQFADSLKAPQ